MRKMSVMMVPLILTDDQKQRRFHMSSGLLLHAKMFDRVITDDETWCFQYDPEKKPEHAVEFTSAEKSTHFSLAVQDNVCVFLRSQEDNSL
jgi:hypothetical protein